MNVTSAIRCLVAATLLLTASAAHAEQKQPLRGLTYASLQTLPDWSGWWSLGEALPIEMAKQRPPLKPELAAKMAAALAQDAGGDPRLWCRPRQFVGYNGGFVDMVEVLFTPGRVTLTTEMGVLRRIYTDGRALPTDPEPTNMGTSVGRWEGDTLVVETVGLNPDATYPGVAPGAPKIGHNARITERISLKSPNTLAVEITVVAPEILTTPDKRTRLYTRAQRHVFHEVSFCTDNDRSVDPASGKQRFDMTPPADLPPPPPR
jgi:hypothetical protein